MLTGHKSLRWARAPTLLLGLLILGASLSSGARGSALARHAPANGVLWAVERGAYAALVVDDEVVVASRGTSHPGGALRLRTLSARRGAGIADAPVVGVASAVGVTIHRGPIDERVESREEGIEQTWRFGVRPRGAGDLVVRVRVEGNRYAGKSAHGLAFVDDETRARMTYGDGTWVDADGVRAEVPARFVDGAVELRVSSALVEASAFPAILDPSVGPEFAMDSPVFNPVTSPDLYEDVEVGYGAGTYLVTWFDGSLPQPRQAVRVRAGDGVVLDASPIGLLAGKPLAIASDGTNFLLAWSGGAARLAIRDGALLDGPAGFTTPTQSPGVSYVSSTGEYVAAWSAGTNVSRVAINAASATIGAPQAVAATGTGAVPTVAGATTGVLVAWADQRSGTSAWDIFGSLSSTPNFPLAHSLTAKSSPSAASDGTDYFVAWNALQLSGTRVRASDGAALDGTMGIPLSMATASPARTSFDGVNYLVAYAGNAAIQVVRVAPGTGSLLDGAPASGGITVATAPSGTSFLSPAIASSATESLVAWVATNGAPVVMASRVRASDGALLDGPGDLTIALSKQHTSPGTANSETLPVVATDGASYLVSWLDDRVSPAAVPSYGMLVRASDGALLDTSALPLPIAPIGLAFDGTTFFASGKSASTHIRRADGVELDLPNGIAAAGQSVACVAGTCLVVESRWVLQPSGSYPTVFVQRVRASDGALLDPPGGVQISQRLLLNSDEALVAAGSSSFLVAWREQQHSSVTLKYAIVDRLGGVTGPFSLSSPGHGLILNYGSLAADGTNFLAEYSCADCLPGGLMATRIRESDGTMLDGVPGLGAIMVAPNGPTLVSTTTSSTTFDGNNFLTLYEGPSGLLGARVRPSDGALLDGEAGTGFGVTSSVGLHFALASAGQGRAMAVYSDGARVRARLIDEADGILDAGGAVADGAVDPARDGGADGQTAEGGMSSTIPDAASDGGLLVGEAEADGAVTTAVDASVLADSAATGAIDAASAPLEASSGKVPADARADDAADARQSPGSGMAGGGGGSGGCSMTANPASNGGLSGRVLAMMVGGLALVRARRRPRSLAVGSV